MISEEEARSKILDAIKALPSRKLPILEALDRFAAEDYFARLPLPNFDNSAMDGYAVIANDCRPGAMLRVIGEQPAGADRRLRISSGQTVRIFTGAPIPAGADAVVMQEDVTRSDNEITLNESVEAGEFVRKRGCDLSEGQKILNKGQRIGSATVGLLASQGLTEVRIGGEVRAAIVSGGDELAKPGENLQAGQIYESNSAMLQSLLAKSGATVASAEHCSDTTEALRRAFESAAGCEILIVSGGVSVGEHDLVQAALRSLGAEIDIWRVAIKPGKPFLFGRLKQTLPSLGASRPSLPKGEKKRDRHKTTVERNSLAKECLVFGLPGNPVSAFVTFLQFVRPAILKMMGATDLDLRRVRANLQVDINNDGDRVVYVRGRFENGDFVPVGRQESHALFGLSQSNSLLRVGIGKSFSRGTIVDIQLCN